MTNPNYTYRELVHHLDLYTTDPLVRKLIDYIVVGEDTVMTSLIDAGMDPASYEFSDSYEYYTPGDYIEHLRKNAGYYEDELHLAQADLQDMTDERDKLKTRSIMDFINEVTRERTLSREKEYEARQNSARLEQENAELKDKINVWTIMER